MQATGGREERSAHWRLQMYGNAYRLENVEYSNSYLVFARSAENITTLVGHDDLNRDLLNSEVFPTLHRADEAIGSVAPPTSESTEPSTTLQEGPTSSGEVPTALESSTDTAVHTDFNWLVITSSQSIVTSLRIQSGDCYLAFDYDGLPEKDMCQVAGGDPRAEIIFSIVF